MPDNTNTLRIWSHLRQIAPLSKVGGAAWFSLNLAPVLVSDPLGITIVTPQVAAQYLQPWAWQWTTLRVALFQGGNFLSTLPADVIVMTEVPIGKLTDAFTAEFNATAAPPSPATFQSSCFVESLTNPAPPPTADANTLRDWKTYLLHASSYAGDIPLRVGLVAWFQIPYVSLAGADEIVVAPVFAGAPFHAPLLPLDASTGGVVRLKPTLDPYAAGDTNWVRRWRYSQPTTVGDLQAEWIQPYTILRTPAAAGWTPSPWDSDGFIAEETLWVTPAPGRWSQNTDSHEQLEQRLSGLFDLPSRLLEWADQMLLSPTNPPPLSIDANFGAALIATMRDLVRTAGEPAALQFLERPDTGTVAGDIAQLLAPRDSAVQAQFVAAVRTYYAKFDIYANWSNLLNTRFRKEFPSVQLPDGWEKPPAAGGDFVTWLKLMHRVRAWLFNPISLNAFIKEDWDAALQANSALYTIWQSKSSDVDAYLTNTDIVTIQRQAFLGQVWKNQTGDWYAPGNLIGKMQIALVNVYRERLGLQPQSSWGYQNLQPHAVGAQVEQADIEAYLNNFIAKWSTAAGGPNPGAGTTADYSRGNRGINIQFANYATMGGTNTVPSGITEDQYLATFRGVAVMMRVSGQNPWSFLHLGQYSVRTEVDPTKQHTPLYDADRVVVAPTGIVYRNGLRQVSCTYRNQPLSARSPAAALSQVRSFQTDPTTTTPGLFEFWNPYRGSPFKLPRLVFGQSYDVAAFAVGLAGELPAEISDGAKPWRVTTDPTKWNPPATATAAIGPYKRTVPIGPVRVEGAQSWTAGTGISKMTGPSIPDGVYPIIRSTTNISDQEGTVILLCDPSSTAWNPDVAVKNSHATIYLRPPATDLATFDSWPLALGVADRAALYSYIAQNTDVYNDNDPKSGPDLTLDDPAVTSFFATLTQIYPKPAAGVVPLTQTIPIGPPRPPSPPAPTLLTQHQSQSVGVDFRVGPAKIAPPAGGSVNWTITVPAGMVYKIEIQPATVDLTNLSIRPNVTARTFYVEVAKPLAFDPKTVAATLNSALACAPAFPQVNAADPLTVSLDLAALGGLAPQIHRVELMIQRWRWQGRPLARAIGKDANGDDAFSFDFPYDDLAAAKPPATVDTVLEPLDGIYFGEREPSDQLIVSAQVDSLLPGPAANMKPLLYSYDLSHAPQALYYRFAVRVFSRYEGMLTTGASEESRIDPASPAEQWRRTLPLCRRTQRASKPAVRLIVPLTQTSGTQRTPGLLVVLDEPWFDWGGLAEQLNVKVTWVDKPEFPPPPNPHLIQAGPDPIVSNPTTDSPPQVSTSLRAVGPIGFTGDTDTNAPLFSKTSFVIPAPAQASNGTTDLSWWFLQLSFQRALNLAGTLTPNGLDSDWTDPIQVQLLPAANLWSVTWTAGGTSVPAPRLDADDLTVQFSAAGIAVFDPAGNQLIVNPTPTDAPPPGIKVRNRFEIWALLTFSLDDAFGHAGQEGFVNLVPFSKLTGYQVPPGRNAPTALRLVEVQCMNDYSPSRNSWNKLPDGSLGLADDLFPPQTADKLNPPNVQPPQIDPAMARARIVRVSPPVRQV